VSTTTEPGAASDALAPVSLPRQTAAFARRTLRGLFRNRAALLWGLGAPVFFYLVFGVAMSPDSTGVVRGANAVAFGVFGAFSVSLVVFATALSDDITNERYRKLRSLPVSPAADVLGRSLGALALAGCSFALVLGVGLATGATLELRSLLSVPVVLGSLVLFCLVAMAGAVVVTSVVTDGEYVVGVTNMLALGLFFLTGYNGLVPRLAPDPLPALANVAPNALAARLGVYHLTPVTAGTPSLTPPALPIGSEYLALLTVEALLTTFVAVRVAHRRLYATEVGE